MSVRIHGAANQGPIEVDTNTLAAYFSARPSDFGYLGSYSLGTSIAVNPGLTSNSGWGAAISNAPIHAVQWTAQNAVCLLKKFVVSIGDATAGVSGIATAQAFFARGYTKQYTLIREDTGAGSGVGALQDVATNVVLGQGCKLRGTMPNSLLAGQIVAAPIGITGVAGLAGTAFSSQPPGTNIVTAFSNFSISGFTLTYAGLLGSTLTLDAQPFGSVSQGTVGTTGLPTLAPTALFDARASDYPIVFDMFTGMVLQVTLPGSNANINYTISTTMVWDEYSLYF